MTRHAIATASANSAARPPAKNGLLPRSPSRLCRKAAEDLIGVAAVVPRVCVGPAMTPGSLCEEVVAVAVDVELAEDFCVDLLLLIQIVD